MPPTKFHIPICQPSVRGAGTNHLFCVSIANSSPLAMKHAPPAICGTQKTPFVTRRLRWLIIPGRPVKPLIQKMVAPMSWMKEAWKPISRM